MGNVLQVYPSPEFVAKLPDGRIPDRSDFVTFMDNQKQRTENWHKVVDIAAPLGEEFLELVASGRIKEVVEKLD